MPGVAAIMPMCNSGSAFVRNSVLSFSPDVIGDLLFNGVTPCARRSDLAEGVQADASWRINDSYTLRGGFLGQVETTAFDTNSFVLPIDAMWAQTSNVPFGIVDNGARTGGLYGVYLQDEWRLLPALAGSYLNYGFRFDADNERRRGAAHSGRSRLNAVRGFIEVSTRLLTMIEKAIETLVLDFLDLSEF
jgi:hypothetical protein